MRSESPLANFGDFSSLLQLGVGIGIGLSLFRAPLELRTRKLEATLSDQSTILEGISSDEAKSKRQTVATLRLELARTTESLERLSFPLLIAALIGAAANVILLILATLFYNSAVNDISAFGLIFASVGYYLLTLLILEIIARLSLSKVEGGIERL